MDRAGFERLRDAGQLLEWAEVHGNLYGTALAEVERARGEGTDILLDLDVQGAAQVRQKLPEAVSVFILPPSYPALEQRLRGRGEDDAASIERRLAAAGREIVRLLALRLRHRERRARRAACWRSRASSVRRAAVCPAVAEQARAIEKTFETKEETKTA